MESPRGVVGRTAAKAAANKWWNCVVPHEGRGFQVIGNGLAHACPTGTLLDTVRPAGSSKPVTTLLGMPDAGFRRCVMVAIAMTREMGTLGKDVAQGIADSLGLKIIHSELIEHDLATR